MEQSPRQICCPISLDALSHADSQSFDSGHGLLLPEGEVAEISVILLPTDLQNGLFPKKFLMSGPEFIRIFPRPGFRLPVALSEDRTSGLFATEPVSEV